MLLPAVQRMRYGSEAVALLLAHAFSSWELGWIEVRSRVDLDGLLVPFEFQRLEPSTSGEMRWRLSHAR
jgi:hypothetical protein